jgi:AraC-like DNA-binding protein
MSVAAGWLFVYSVRAGTCRLIVQERSLVLHEGDTAILPQCGAHELLDDRVTSASRQRQVVWFDPDKSIGLSADHLPSPGPKTSLLVCRFRRPARRSELFLTVLPQYIVHRRGQSESNQSLEPTIALLEREVAKRTGGICPIIEHLCKALMLQVSHNRAAQESVEQGADELMVTDPVILRALGLMHSRPDISWTVETLAAAVGVSRSTFAARFVSRLNETPLSYLRRERMQKAADLLVDETLGIKEIAALVGYDSESAFSNAFKQWCGTAPGAYRRERHC